MNPSDSKKLEEIEKRYSDQAGFVLTRTVDMAEDIGWLISKVKEQDREIEQLRRMTPIANVQLSGDAEYWKRKADYQRRHRKWALERLKSALYNLFVIVPKMKKAEAEIARLTKKGK